MLFGIAKRGTPLKELALCKCTIKICLPNQQLICKTIASSVASSMTLTVYPLICHYHPNTKRTIISCSLTYSPTCSFACLPIIQSPACFISHTYQFADRLVDSETDWLIQTHICTHAHSPYSLFTWSFALTFSELNLLRCILKFQSRSSNFHSMLYSSHCAIKQIYYICQPVKLFNSVQYPSDVFKATITLSVYTQHSTGVLTWCIYKKNLPKVRSQQKP